MKQWLHGIGGLFAPRWRHCRGNAAFSQLIALEDRSLLSATPLEPELVTNAVEGSQPFTPSHDIAVVAPGTGTTSAAVISAAQAAETAAHNITSQNQRLELVVVDPSVANYQQLVNDLKKSADPARQLDVVVLQPNQDGMDQITQLLAGYKNLDAFHLITHGTSDGVVIGNTWLNSSNLSSYADQFREWRLALSSDADILFYGCDVAQTPTGQQFLQNISNWTGADVAASTDNTGNAIFGANWNLEFATGHIETTVALDQTAQAQWQGLLASLTVTTTSDIVDGNTSSIASLLASEGADGKISLREAILATNNTPGADTINLPTGTYILSIAGQGENAGATGDLDITDGLTILGGGSGLSIVDANGLDRVFHVQPGKSATISDITLRGGVLPSNDYGAGILVDAGANLTLSRVVITANSAGSGAGLYNYGTLIATDTTFSNNTAIDFGGGLYNDRGPITLDRVTISGNTAGKDGGGVLNTGLGATLSMVNVTISGNTAIGQGGGLWTSRAATATNVTIAFNDAAAGDGVFGQGGPGTVSFKNSILYNPAGANANKAMTSLDNNIDSDGTAGLAGSGDVVTNPQLAALANYGGYTATHALLAGSLAINTGTATGAPATDQRGIARLGATDKGAFEYAANMLFVDTTSDVADGNTSSVAALLANKGADGKISLREAILATNNTANLSGPDTIAFNIPISAAGRYYYRNDGIANSLTNIQATSLADASITDFDPDYPYAQHTWFRINLNPASGALAITDRVIIDGYTQSGASQNTLAVGQNANLRIELTSIGADGDSGLSFRTGASGSTVRGLAINAFDFAGVWIDPGVNNITIQGNFLGTDITGTIDLGNAGAGVEVRSSNNLVGGPNPADRNVLSGNNYSGVSIAHASADNNQVVGNYIGVNAAGVGALGNSIFGVVIYDGADGNQIGDVTSGSGNVIAYNNRGVLVDANPTASINNSIRGNSIYGQVGLGIDLNNDGVSLNDPGDLDLGANNTRNFPVITSAVLGGTTLTIAGTLNAIPLLNSDIDFYWSPTGDSSGYGEGKAYIGSTNVTPDFFGNASFNVAFTGVSVPSGAVISATTTDINGNTSEFSLNRTATAANTPPTITSNGGGDSASMNVAENSTAVTTVIATDANVPAQTLTYSIVPGADSAKFSINGSSGALSFVAAPNFESPTDIGLNNVYNVTVQVSDGNGGTDTQAISVTVIDQNDNNPVVTAGQTRNVNENAVNGFGLGAPLSATDADSVGTLQSWAIINGNTDGIFAINAATGQLTVVNNTNLNFESRSSYTLGIRVGDGANTSATTNVVVNINNINEPPTVTPIANKTILESDNTGALAFTVGDPETAAGSLIVTATSNNQAIIPDANLVMTGTGASRTITATPVVGQSGGPVIITVTVSDGVNQTQELFDVTVVPRVITVATTADEENGDTTDILTLLANPGGAGISLREAIIATNNTNIGATPDRIILPSGTYLLGASALPGVSDALLITGGGARTTTVDAQNSFRVFDISNNTTTMTGLTIQGGNSFDGGGVYVQGGSTLNLTDVRLTGNVATGQSGGAIHVHGSLNLNRVLLDNNTAGDGGALGIHGGSGTLTNVTISGNTATSGEGGAIHVDGSITITNSTIANNTGTTVGGIYLASGSVNLANSILANNGANSNPGITSGGYNIDSNGTASLSGTGDQVGNPLLNALTNNGGPTDTHSLIGGSLALNPVGLTGAPLVDQRGVIRDGTPDIGAYEGSVGNVIGSINDSNASADQVAENAANGTVVGVTAAATDPDVGDSVTYTLTDDAGGRFAINVTTGIVTVADGSLLNYEAAASQNITVKATSSDGSSSTGIFTISILPVNDNNPVITSNGGGATAFVNVDENATAVTTVTATDADLPAQTLTYSIIPGMDGLKFNIDTNTGALTFVAAPDFESPTDGGLDNVYEVRVEVSDGNFTNTQDIFITINPINESAPVITSGASFTVNENSLAVTVVTATDADRPVQTLTFSIVSGGDAGQFMIDPGTGFLSFITPPDFESPTDIGANNVYQVTVQVSDGALTSSQTVFVTVVNVNDNAPTATNLSAIETYTEDTAFNLTAIVISDVDGGNVTATLTLSNVAAGSLNTGTSGAVTSTFVAGVWTATGAIADVNTLLAGLTFTPALDFDSNFTIAASVSDGVAAPMTGSKAITGTPVNDAPTATNLSAAETYTEDTPLNLTGIVVSDVDSPNVTAALTLSNVAAGSLNTGTSGAVTSTFVAGVWTATGAIADVDTLLAGLTFTPALDFDSNFTIATNVSDGVAAPMTGSKAITGTPVNDAPTATNLSAAETYTEDTPLNLTGIVVSDVDSPNVTAALTLSNVAAGSLNTGTSGAVTSTFVAGVWTASGAIADVNALLAGLTFTPTVNFNGNFTIGSNVSDGVATQITGNKVITVTMPAPITPVVPANPGAPITLLPSTGNGNSVTNNAPAKESESNTPAFVSFISPTYQNRIDAPDVSSAEQHALYFGGGANVANVELGSGRNFAGGNANSFIGSGNSLHVEAVLFSTSAGLSYRLPESVELESAIGRSWSTLLTSDVSASPPAAPRSVIREVGGVEVRGLAATGMLATTGYLLLNTRALSWVLTLMLSQSAWQNLDPLEVIYAAQDDDPENQKAKASRFWWQEVGLR